MTGPAPLPLAAAMAHAFLPPSGAAAWVECALWPTMNQRFPELEEGVEAAEGTAAHWVFGEQLYQRPVDVGHIAANGVPVTLEMLEGADTYVEEVSRAYASLRSVSHYNVEQRVAIPAVHANNWGTPDTWLFGHNATSGRARLIVLDYKFGHEFVEVFENWQLVDYASGILDALEVDGLADEFIDVEFVVVQPRSYHKDGTVRRWSTTARELRPLVNKLAGAAEAAHMPKPVARPTPKACKHCPGRHSCEALQREAYFAADVAGMSTPVEMSVDAMGLELRMLQRAQKLLEARASGLAEQLEHALAGGQASPYFALAPGESKLVWSKPAEEVLALGQLAGVDLAKPREPVTPTQAKKLLDPALVAMYSDRTRAALKLTPVDTVGARKVFGKIS
jgi:hypothetical protein